MRLNVKILIHNMYSGFAYWNFVFKLVEKKSTSLYFTGLFFGPYEIRFSLLAALRFSKILLKFSLGEGGSLQNV